MLALVGTLGIGFHFGAVPTGLIALHVVGLLYRHMLEQVEVHDRSLIGITLGEHEPKFRSVRASERTVT